MAIDLILSPDKRSNEPLEQARRQLLSGLAALKMPYVPTWPDPETFEDIKAMAREVAALADTWLRAVGEEVESNAPVNINRELFKSAFTDAIDGNATFELDRCAEVTREDQEQEMAA